MANRQINKAKLRSGLVVQVGYYTSIEDVDKDAGKAGAALHFINTYMQQKSALPDANAYIAEEVIGKLEPAFPEDPKKIEVTKEKQENGTEKEVRTNTETAGELIARFVATVDAGKATYPGIEKGKALAWLQAALDKHGPFNLDAKTPERKSKPKTPPQYCTAAANSVFDDTDALNGKKREAFVKHWETKINADLVKYGKVGSFKLTGDKEADKLAFAWAVHERDTAKREQEANNEFAAPIK